GKEVAARLAHRLSARSRNAFLKVNCAALPAELLESELFGFEAGAFTGANRAKPGKFELCNHGTMFLDEIGEMAPPLQAKLLQVLEEGRFTRLGGRSVVTVDVRVVAATNLEMREALERKQFREDLYYRLSAVSVVIPPLRERREEIAPLLEFFRDRLCQQWQRPPVALPPELVAACYNYSWPGNVRELQNLVKRLVILGDAAGLVEDLNRSAGARTGARVLEFPHPETVSNLKEMVRQLKFSAESRAIHCALDRANWNRRAAAQALGISAKSLMHKMQQYGIRWPPLGAAGMTNDGRPPLQVV